MVMEASTTNLDATKKTKFMHVLNSYMPTNERTWNYAIPIFGFSLSCFSFGIFIAILQDIKLHNEIFNYGMYDIGYMVLAGAASIELYYGLTHRSRRQFCFWIFFKIFECLLVISGILLEFLASYKQQIDVVSCDVLILILDIIVMIFVVKRSSKRQRKNIENVYEVPNASQYSNVSVY